MLHLDSDLLPDMYTTPRKQAHRYLLASAGASHTLVSTLVPTEDGTAETSGRIGLGSTVYSKLIGDALVVVSGIVLVLCGMCFCDWPAAVSCVGETPWGIRTLRSRHLDCNVNSS